jgi:hypothetical protein
VYGDGPTPESLRRKNFVEKIYTMLSDDTDGTETNENTEDMKDDSAQT